MIFPPLTFSFLPFLSLWSQVFPYATNTLVMTVMPSCRSLSMLALAIAMYVYVTHRIPCFHRRIFLEFVISYAFLIVSRNSSCLFLFAYLVYSSRPRSSISISICVHITLL